jgi:glucokinase
MTYVSEKAFGGSGAGLSAGAKTQARVLLGDIGATNARLAELVDGELGPVTSFAVARFPTMLDLLKTYLDDHGSEPAFTGALLAVAGPVANDCTYLTNTSWIIDAPDIEAAFGLEVRLINDFQAVAYSLPTLGADDDLVQIGGGKPQQGSPKLALGPGSGLGVACFIESGGEPLVVASEGGHATLAGTCDREDAIISLLRQRFGHASAERAISGPGLENIFQAIVNLDGLDRPAISAAEITQRALKNECAVAHEALCVFCALLGCFAGSMALTFNARGGVYIAGGISPRIINFLAHSQFRTQFESKGRFRRNVAEIPTYVIVHPAAAFVGLKTFIAQRRTCGTTAGVKSRSDGGRVHQAR